MSPSTQQALSSVTAVPSVAAIEVVGDDVQPPSDYSAKIPEPASFPSVAEWSAGASGVVQGAIVSSSLPSSPSSTSSSEISVPEVTSHQKRSPVQASLDDDALLDGNRKSRTRRKSDSGRIDFADSSAGILAGKDGSSENSGEENTRSSGVCLNALMNFALVRLQRCSVNLQSLYGVCIDNV